MTAPVSLAEIKALLRPCGAKWPEKCDGRGWRSTQGTCVICKGTTFDGWREGVQPPSKAFAALVELAEAYLEWRDLDKRPKGMGFGGFEAAQAHERLALAAKGVRL